MTITEFLLARIAEDEAAARAASPSPWSFGDVKSVAGGSLYDQTRMIGDLHYEQMGDHDGRIIRHLLSDEADANGAHIARHDPARVLAECEAKRRIIGVHRPIPKEWVGGAITHPCECMCVDCADTRDEWPCETLRTLASVYSDHPDFDPAWRA